MKFGFPSPDWRPHHSEAPNPNAPTRHMSSMVKRTLFEKNPENWWTLGSSGFWEPRKSCHTLAILGTYLTFLFHVHISCGFNSEVIQRFLQQMMLAASSPQIQAGQRIFKIGESTGKKNETLSMQSQRLRIGTGRFQVQLVNVQDFGWQTPWMSKPMKAKERVA